MDTNQQLLTELLKIKTYLVGKMANHHMAVSTQEMLEMVNEALNAIETKGQ